MPNRKNKPTEEEILILKRDYEKLGPDIPELKRFSRTQLAFYARLHGLKKWCQKTPFKNYQFGHYPFVR